MFLNAMTLFRITGKSHSIKYPTFILHLPLSDVYAKSYELYIVLFFNGIKICVLRVYKLIILSSALVFSKYV